MNQIKSINPSYSREFGNAVMTAYKTNPAAALAPALELHLWKDPTFNPQPNTPAVDFAAMECDFTDYAAAAALVLTVPVNLTAQAVGAINLTVFAIINAVVVSNQVYGYWLESAGMVVMFERNPEGAGVPMAATGDVLEVLLALPLVFQQAAA